MNTQKEITYTRQQLLNNECTHAEYYNQFVNAEIISRVKCRIGANKIKNAILENENFNTIPLVVWDGIAMNLYDVSSKMKLAGDYLTLAGGVCIAKAAARIVAQETE